MTKDFNLSEKIDYGISCSDNNGRYGFIEERDVKEFIKILKEKFHNKAEKGILILTDAYNIVDKSAGDKLT